MTYALAMAAAVDHANRRMRAAGRTAWNRADYNAMVREFERLFPCGPITANALHAARGNR